MFVKYGRIIVLPARGNDTGDQRAMAARIYVVRLTGHGDGITIRVVSAAISICADIESLHESALQVGMIVDGPGVDDRDLDARPCRPNRIGR